MTIPDTPCFVCPTTIPWGFTASGPPLEECRAAIQSLVDISSLQNALEHLAEKGECDFASRGNTTNFKTQFGQWVCKLASERRLGLTGAETISVFSDEGVHLYWFMYYWRRDKKAEMSKLERKAKSTAGRARATGQSNANGVSQDRYDELKAELTALKSSIAASTRERTTSSRTDEAEELERARVNMELVKLREALESERRTRQEEVQSMNDKVDMEKEARIQGLEHERQQRIQGLDQERLERITADQDLEASVQKEAAERQKQSIALESNFKSMQLTCHSLNTQISDETTARELKQRGLNDFLRLHIRIHPKIEVNTTKLRISTQPVVEGQHLSRLKIGVSFSQLVDSVLSGEASQVAESIFQKLPNGTLEAGEVSIWVMLGYSGTGKSMLWDSLYAKANEMQFKRLRLERWSLNGTVETLVAPTNETISTSANQRSSRSARACVFEPTEGNENLKSHLCLIDLPGDEESTVRQNQGTSSTNIATMLLGSREVLALLFPSPRNRCPTGAYPKKGIEQTLKNFFEIYTKDDTISITVNLVLCGNQYAHPASVSGWVCHQKLVERLRR